MITNTDSEYVTVGKLGSTYGIQGWLKIYSYTEIPVDILEYAPWYMSENDGWQAIEVKAGRQHGKIVIVKFAGYDSPEKARQLTNKLIAVKRSQLPTLAKNEYYWRDLEGLTVINQDGNELGKIANLMETGANDIIVVRLNGKEHAIPYLFGKVVTRIDLENKIMYVDWNLI